MTRDLTIVIPAAGASSRMGGQDKLLRRIDGTPLLRVVAARAVQIAPTRVVLGPDHDARAAALDGLDLRIIRLDRSGGMAASLVAGFHGVETAGTMVLLADMPDIRAEDLGLMAALWQAGAGPILRGAAQDGTPGHPVILPKKLYSKIAGLTGDRGAGNLLLDRPQDVTAVPLPGTRALTDLDTPQAWADWEAARANEKTAP